MEKNNREKWQLRSDVQWVKRKIVKYSYLWCIFLFLGRERERDRERVHMHTDEDHEATLLDLNHCSNLPKGRRWSGQFIIFKVDYPIKQENRRLPN